MDYLNLNMKTMWYFETSGNSGPTTVHYSPEDMNFQQNYFENFKFCNFTWLYLKNSLPVSVASLGAFTKLRKATVVSSCLSFCPSVRVEHLGYHFGHFHEILSTFRKQSRKFKFNSKLARITHILHVDLSTIMICLTELFLEWEIFQKN